MTMWLDLDGVANMRDLGGTPTADGASIAPGRLLRSDNLQELSPADIEALREHGLTNVVDLRTDGEANNTGPGPLDAQPWVTVQRYSLAPEVGSPQPRLVATGIIETDSDDISSTWTAHYLAYLYERPDSVVAALRTIAQAPGATIVHCAAGKDRTGTIVAFALLLAGVRTQDIVADYAASAERIEAIITRLKRVPMYAKDLEGQHVDEQRPTPQIMAAVLEGLAPQSDPAPLLALLAQAGWTESDTAQLRAKLRDDTSTAGPAASPPAGA